jgi:hypothetical protein
MAGTSTASRRVPKSYAGDDIVPETAAKLASLATVNPPPK